MARTVGTSSGWSGLVIPPPLVPALSIVLSVICILTDITRRSIGEEWEPRYTSPPHLHNHSRDLLVLDTVLKWSNGMVLASEEFRVPTLAASRRRRRSTECFFYNGMPFLDPQYQGVAVDQCLPGETLSLAPECDSGTACLGLGHQRCAASGGCSLQQWTPCIHTDTCLSLPSLWPLDAPEVCPNACPEGFVHDAALDPCREPGARLRPPICRSACQDPPVPKPHHTFRLSCPRQIPAIGMPCQVVPPRGYSCTPKRAGCASNLDSIRCKPIQCPVNRTQQTAPEKQCPAGTSLSILPQSSCRAGKRLSTQCSLISTATVTPSIRARGARRPPMPSPTPSCCPSGNGYGSVWNGHRCVCTLEHLGFLPGSDHCCLSPQVFQPLTFLPWEAATISGNTRRIACTEACSVVRCASHRGCYGFTRTDLLVSSGAWVPGPTTIARMASIAQFTDII